MLYKPTHETAKVKNKQEPDREKNCILIMDNARIHRTDKIKQLLKKRNSCIHFIIRFSRIK